MDKLTKKFGKEQAELLYASYLIKDKVLGKKKKGSLSDIILAILNATTQEDALALYIVFHTSVCLKKKKESWKIPEDDTNKILNGLKSEIEQKFPNSFDLD